VQEVYISSATKNRPIDK